MQVSECCKIKSLASKCVGTIVCASIQHVLYLPEVCCQASGSGCAQYLTEQAVTGHLCASPFAFRIMELHLLLVANLWNTFVVPCPPGDATPQLCSGLSKKERCRCTSKLSCCPCFCPSSSLHSLAAVLELTSQACFSLS